MCSFSDFSAFWLPPKRQPVLGSSSTGTSLDRRVKCRFWRGASNSKFSSLPRKHLSPVMLTELRQMMADPLTILRFHSLNKVKMQPSRPYLGLWCYQTESISLRGHSVWQLIVGRVRRRLRLVLHLPSSLPNRWSSWGTFLLCGPNHAQRSRRLVGWQCIAGTLLKTAGQTMVLFSSWWPS